MKSLGFLNVFLVAGRHKTAMGAHFTTGRSHANFVLAFSVVLKFFQRVVVVKIDF